MTMGDLPEKWMAIEEEQLSVPEDNSSALFFENRQAVKNPKTPTSFERRVLRLRFFDGLDRRALAKQLRCSIPHVQRTIRSAIAKLRCPPSRRAPGRCAPPEGRQPERLQLEEMTRILPKCAPLKPPQI